MARIPVPLLGAGQLRRLLEAEVAVLINAGSNYLVSGKVPGRWGNAHPTIVPYQSFQTEDSYLVVGVASEGIWQRFCAAIGKSELARDPRFERNPDRVANRDALIPVLSEIFRSRNNETWLHLLNEAEVPCAPIQTIGGAVERVARTPRDTAVMAAAVVLRLENGVCRQARVSLSHAGSEAELMVVFVPRLEGRPVSADLLKAVYPVIKRASPEAQVMLGGIAVPHSRGLAGHSDADVVLHVRGGATREVHVFRLVLWPVLLLQVLGEPFGPVLAILTFEEEQEAVDLLRVAQFSGVERAAVDAQRRWGGARRHRAGLE